MADIGDHRWRSQRPGEERPTVNRDNSVCPSQKYSLQ
nr:hypothetical protein Iba_chr09aCG10270 [Ipomoea batatas]GME02851.1 hypothetical protein Iba_scaffold182CG0030 [Ipomoea batatas]